jgi:beta-galactosidase/beta-glucuronidase
MSAKSLVLWDLGTPQLYVATVTVQDQAGHVLAEVNESFGFRSFSTSGMSFLLNGEPIFLSGYGDDNIFPLTYAPPTERTWYDKKFRLAKQVSAATNVSHAMLGIYI